MRLTILLALTLAGAAHGQSITQQMADAARVEAALGAVATHDAAVQALADMLKVSDDFHTILDRYDANAKYAADQMCQYRHSDVMRISDAMTAAWEQAVPLGDDGVNWYRIGQDAYDWQDWTLAYYWFVDSALAFEAADAAYLDVSFLANQLSGALSRLSDAMDAVP